MIYTQKLWISTHLLVYYLCYSSNRLRYKY